MGDGLQGVLHTHRPQGGLLQKKRYPLNNFQDFIEPDHNKPAPAAATIGQPER